MTIDAEEVIKKEESKERIGFSGDYYPEPSAEEDYNNYDPSRYSVTKLLDKLYWDARYNASDAGGIQRGYYKGVWMEHVDKNAEEVQYRALVDRRIVIELEERLVHYQEPLFNDREWINNDTISGERAYHRKVANPVHAHLERLYMNIEDDFDKLNEASRKADDWHNDRFWELLAEITDTHKAFHKAFHENRYSDATKLFNKLDDSITLIWQEMAHLKEREELKEVKNVENIDTTENEVPENGIDEEGMKND